MQNFGRGKPSLLWDKIENRMSTEGLKQSSARTLHSLLLQRLSYKNEIYLDESEKTSLVSKALRMPLSKT